MTKALTKLRSLDALNWKEFTAWVRATNPAWLGHIEKPRKAKKKLRLPETWPAVPGDVKRRWEDYWEEPYPGGER